MNTHENRPSHTTHTERDLSIDERLAWLHRDLSILASADLVELKHNLKAILEDASVLHDLVAEAVQVERSRLKKQEAAKLRAAEGETVRR